ncbi:MAG: hypothetical protein AKCLJLPJ_00654 [Fimbriimonadales bacterium]|nr:hypothetical protein [Fimbriimonadales bacterium]
MFVTALIAALGLQTTTVELSRGAALTQDPHTRYWSSEDTVLDPKYPERSFGQGSVLWLGDGGRVLIRFADLERAIGPNRRILSAKLVIQLEHVSKAGEAVLKRFHARWNEGPGFGERQATPLHGATTWVYQFFNAFDAPRRWQRGGEKFVDSKASATVTVARDTAELVFTGLEADVQDMYERWFDNWGWSIDFSGSAAGNSAQSRYGRPKLILQTAPSEPAGGADLSVVCIERTPEYKRYDNRGDAYVRKEVAGHESGVMMNPGSANEQKWPADGEEVTYTAVIKNVGTSASGGFRYEIAENDESSSSGEVSQPLAPGESRRIEWKTKFKNAHKDHRTQPISFQVEPASADASKGNNYLEIQACALNLGIWVDKGFYEEFAKGVSGTGTRSFEDWIQWQFRIWNDVFLAQSRFSFAQDGCRERVRVGRITIVDNGILAGGAHLPNDSPTLIYDGEWGFDSSFGNAAGYINDVRAKADRALIHECSHQIGLIDLYQMNVDPSLPSGEGGKVRLKVGEHVITRGRFDVAGGLMGGGDTRNEALVPVGLPIPNQPIDTIVSTGPLFEATDLYALTDVAALNMNLGYRRGFYGEFLYSMPQVVLARCVDRSGSPIPSGRVSFYQMKNGAIQDGPPDFEAEIEGGTVILPARPTGLDEPFTTETGHTLRPNPFGRLDVVGSNGVLLARLDVAGQTEWAWLKAWQLYDAYARGNKSAFVFELRFNICPRPIDPREWAKNKVAIDKRGSDPENLARLLDGDPKTAYEAGSDEGDWFEIDIGRDRQIAEIKLVMSGDTNAFWRQFDILVYTTGSRANEALRFASEIDFRDAMTFDREIDPKDFGVRSVAYRRRPMLGRFIRFVSKAPGAGRLYGIEIREAAAPAGVP